MVRLLLLYLYHNKNAKNMDIIKKAFQDHIDMFSQINYVKTLEYSESEDARIMYHTKIGSEKVWHFGLSVSKISNKWYIHYYNRLSNCSAEEQYLMFERVHHKHNMLHATYKKYYKEILPIFQTFQKNIVSNYNINLGYSQEKCLNELFKLTEVEKSRSLSFEEDNTYIKLYERLKRDGVEIPFGVTI